MAYLRRKWADPLRSLVADLHRIRRRAAIEQEVGRHVDQAMNDLRLDPET
jgi:hypothetical protein